MSQGKICPQCGTRYDAEHRFCTRDGATLVAENPNDSLIGAIIADRYHVLEKLGEGGMGEVYLAEHVRIRRKVAVKVMRRWMSSDAVALGRFHREAENASQISHPNVATIYDFGETGDGMVYFAMEYVDGEPLSDVLEREGRVGVVRGCDIVRQVADALGAAHALGILHRDLKPDNVMLGKTRVGTEQVKIVDFGISRVMDRGTQQFTSTGMVIGTPDYMSPEQLSGDALDARTDIYALALIAFRTLTGSAAFAGNNPHESLLARLTKPATRLAEALPTVQWPQAMQDVFDRALSPEPDTRFAESLEFAAALEGAAAGMPLTPEDERYLQLLTLRTATPPRGYGIIDAMTPTQGIAPIGEAGATIPRARVWTTTPPSGIGVTAGPSVPPVPAADQASADVVGAVTPGAAPIEAEGAVSSAATPVAPRRAPRRMMALAGGAVTVVATLVLWNMRGSSEQPTGTAADSIPAQAATAPLADSARSAASPADSSGKVAGAVRSDAIVARFSKSVFEVSALAGHGAGFLVDSTGLIVTSAHLVDNDKTVTVQVDATHRYRVPVLASDRGIAVAAIPPRACRSCAVLTPVDDTASVALGDSVVSIGSPESSGRVRRGVVKSASAQRLTASFDIPSRQGGAPIASLTGAVVGAAGRAPGASGSSLQLVPSALMAPVIARARALRANAAIDTALLPVWPVKRIAEPARASGASMSEKDIESYRTKRDGFEVLVMTPQVVAWRRAATSGARSADDPFAVNPRTSAGAVRDALQRWSEWDEYWRERRAVVIVDVSPEAARPPFPGSTKPVEFKKGDVESVSLSRDGAGVPPIEGARVVAVPDAELYSGRALFHSGVLVFGPDAFATGSRFRLEVRDASRGGRAIGIDLPSRAIDRIRADLGEFVSR